jgi:hypothetical protein
MTSQIVNLDNLLIRPDVVTMSLIPFGQAVLLYKAFAKKYLVIVENVPAFSLEVKLYESDSGLMGHVSNGQTLKSV